MLPPDAWFLFCLAFQLLEVQNPQILLGNLIPKRSNKDNLLYDPALTEHPRGLSKTIYRQLQDSEEACEGHPRTAKRVMNNQPKMFIQTSVYADTNFNSCDTSAPRNV